MAYRQFFDPNSVGCLSRKRESMFVCKFMNYISLLLTSTPVLSASFRTSSDTLT